MQIYLFKKFLVDDNLEQSSSNGYRDQNSEIDSYDYCSEFDFDQKSGIHLGIKPSQYVYPDSIISSGQLNFKVLIFLIFRWNSVYKLSGRIR